jgi:hypothetical protein
MAQNEAFRAGLAGIAAMQMAMWLLFIFWPFRPAVAITPAAR